jgi:hypothetical protein
MLWSDNIKMGVRIKIIIGCQLVCSDSFKVRKRSSTNYFIGVLLDIATVAACTAACGISTVRSESHCALTLRYVDLVVSIEVAVEVCCWYVTFQCIQLLHSG